MEASALPVASGISRPPIRIATPLLRLRSDEQLVTLFRRGNDDAFRVIHDRYHERLLAYTRQMLPGSGHDAEDALQEVFVRAYRGLRADERELALRPWLYRVAHNRCIDQLRRRIPPATQIAEDSGLALEWDPSRQAEQREALAHLVADIRRLPHQQRSALLMRELGGMGYEEISAALAVTVPAVKSLLVRARLGLVRAAEARDASCALVQEELVLAHDRRVRPAALARRHLRECSACSAFRSEIRSTGRQAAALVPGAGLLGILTRLLGAGGGRGAAAGGSAAAGGGAAAAGAASTGGLASIGLIGAGASHVAGLVAAAVVTAGGAVAIQPAIAPPATHHHIARAASHAAPAAARSAAPPILIAVTRQPLVEAEDLVATAPSELHPRAAANAPAATSHHAGPPGGSNAAGAQSAPAGAATSVGLAGNGSSPDPGSMSPNTVGTNPESGPLPAALSDSGAAGQSGSSGTPSGDGSSTQHGSSPGGDSTSASSSSSASGSSGASAGSGANSSQSSTAQAQPGTASSSSDTGSAQTSSSGQTGSGQTSSGQSGSGSSSTPS